ncbi:MAG: TetR/AcrR family transcriptional regulator [Chloroherpetonaceae bacterium]|nr:TetR/AcrR family transcriptional regulator [Chloroherpetonaceae bacterium]
MTELTDSKQKIIKAAEPLFMLRGYKGLGMSELASLSGMKQASLYYHFPKGKEELFVAVVQSAIHRHHLGMITALESSETLESQLMAVAEWFFREPPFDILAMFRNDFHHLSTENQRAINKQIYLIHSPVANCIRMHFEKGELNVCNFDNLAGILLSTIQALRESYRFTNSTPQSLFQDFLNTLLVGLRK